MLSDLTSFGHLTISRRASGEPIRVVRSPDEQVFLAFDRQIKRLVELHVLRQGAVMDGSAKRSAYERAQMAAEVRGPSFMRVLEVGEDQGMVYYTSNLNEGEFVSDYIERRGPLPQATVFTLLQHLLDDLLLFSDRQRLVSQMRLDRVMVTTLEDTFLQLRLYDFGLSNDEVEEVAGNHQIIQVCELMFLMLTGKPYAGENPDLYTTLTALPMSLRTTLRTALTDPRNAPTSTEKLRDDVREACGAFISSIQARNSRKQLVITPTLLPHFQLQDLLLENVPIDKVLGSRFRVEDGQDVRRYPFSIPCQNVKNDQPVTVHLLPPARIVEKTEYEAVPLQSWRFSADKHPNILRSLSLWESPDWSFLTEERETGFTLSRLLTERLTLNPTEVVLLLRQVMAGMNQAEECGVEHLEIHPSNLFMKVGKAGPMLNREHDKLMQKRLDAWPPFHVKLRPHLTMRNLYEAPLVELPENSDPAGEHHAVREYRNRTFVALATYVLTGARQIGESPVFPETVPESLAAYIRETLLHTSKQGSTPAPAEFVEKFETAMTGPTQPDLASRIRGSSIAVEEMESVGSVSDFDDDQPMPADDFEDDVSLISRRLHAHEFDLHQKKKTLGWPIWAAAAAIAGLLSWWFMAGDNGEASTVPAPVVATPTISREPTQEAPKPQPAPEKPVTKPMADVPLPPDGPAQSAPKPAAEKSQVTAKIEPKKPEPAKPGSDKVAKATPPAPPKPPAAPETKPIPLPMTPPATVVVPNTVIIRKALLPSAEEIAKFKQGQVKPTSPQMPVQAPSTPQPPKTNNNSEAIPTKCANSQPLFAEEAKARQ